MGMPLPKLWTRSESMIQPETRPSKSRLPSAKRPLLLDCSETDHSASLDVLPRVDSPHRRSFPDRGYSELAPELPVSTNAMAFAQGIRSVPTTPAGAEGAKQAAL